jgi:predicted nucleic acid-binding protein
VPGAAAARDPGDDYLVALARSAGADMILSVDLDLATRVWALSR